MGHEHVEVFNRFFQAGRSVLIAGGHFNNWELYAMTANQNVPHDVMAVYKRLSNTTMDAAVRESRQRLDWKWCAPLIPADGCARQWPAS